jgi:cobalt/nickel transport system permease protein
MRLHDPYIERVSIVHRIPASLKLLMAALLILTSIAIPRHYAIGYYLVAAVIFLIALFSRLPISKLAVRLLLLEPFVIGVSFLSLFQPDGGAVFLYLVIRGSLSLAIMVLLTATTRFNDIVTVLQKARLPGLLVTTLTLMYRYLFVIVSEADKMTRARAGRTFVKSRKLHWRNLSELVGFLFVRTAARAERIYAAMCARGWQE